MKNIIFSCFLFVAMQNSFAQQDLSVTYANTITSKDLKEYLNILASDALEGRETGERGQKMAATFIEYHFKNNGLAPIVNTPAGFSYLQNIDLITKTSGKAWINVGEQTHSNYDNFIFVGESVYQKPQKSKLIFIGEGLEEDYKAVNVLGKSVMIYSIVGQEERNEKAALAKFHGASEVFIIQSGADEEFHEELQKLRKKQKSGRLKFPPKSNEKITNYFLVSTSLGTQILNTNTKSLLSAIQKSKKGKYSSLIQLKSGEITFYVNQKHKKVSTENVLGFLEGSDKKDEFIVITAHYDHEGIDGDKIYNGADDDGSGTVSVLEIAQAFSIAKQKGHGPRRSILFMTVTGEEKGLLGSAYYVNNPVLPLASTIVNLNIDMVGRIDQPHENNPNYIYLIGSDILSDQLHKVSEKTNATYSRLDLDYTFNDINDPNRFYYRSDHYNFAKNNIPVIFYFNGTHKDYHRPTDTVDKINFELLEKRAKLIFHTAWEIANMEDRIKVDKIPEKPTNGSAN